MGARVDDLRLAEDAEIERLQPRLPPSAARVFDLRWAQRSEIRLVSLALKEGHRERERFLWPSAGILAQVIAAEVPGRSICFIYRGSFSFSIFLSE